MTNKCIVKIKIDKEKMKVFRFDNETDARKKFNSINIHKEAKQSGMREIKCESKDSMNMERDSFNL